MLLKKIIRVILGIISVITLAFAIYLVAAIVARPDDRSESSRGSISVQNPKIHVGTIIKEEKVYLCGDRKTIFEGAVPSELIGMSYKDILRRYPKGEGWEVKFEKNDTLSIVQYTDEFCPFHQSFRHFGIYDGFLAVYQGPLGNNSKLIRIEKNIPVSSFSTDYQEKLCQAMKFNEQKPELKVLLRKEMEFTSEDSLNAALENLDELGR